MMNYQQVPPNYEKRLISIFCNFVEKALLPPLRRNEVNLQEWNKFRSMLTLQNPNYNQLQLFVDTLPGSTDKRDPSYSWKKQESAQGLPVSRTFGPEKAKDIVMGLKQLEFQNSFRANKETRAQSTEKGYTASKEPPRPETAQKPKSSSPGSPLLPPSGSNVAVSLERLYHRLLDNQRKIEQLCEAK